MRILLYACLLFALIAPVQGEPVTVAVYNLENWLTMDRYVDGKRVKGQPKPLEEKRAVVEILAKIEPDIIGIVEIGTEADLEDLQKRLKSAGVDLPHRLILEAVDPYRRLALLSAYPIVADDSRGEIPVEVDGKPLHVQRGILDATVRINEDYDLRLLGVHLKSKRPVSEFDEAALRRQEAVELRKTAEKILHDAPRTNLLLFGDLNDTKNEPPVREVIGRRGQADTMIPLDLEGPHGDRWTYHWKWADLYSRIDFIMVSAGLYAEVDMARSGIDRSDNWAEASDHRALYVTFDPVEK